MASQPDAQPVDPSLATGAQIPLQSFTIPSFPPSARGLKALTLTSDIKLDEYNNLLSSTSTPEIPPLPPSIESLTLELFSLGYPPGFLEALSKRLPNLKSLVIYSQLFAGISDDSARDAEIFFENVRASLRALHLLDCFARPGFLAHVGHILGPATVEEVEVEEPKQNSKGLLFLEISYTRQASPEFLTQVPGADLHELIVPSLIACTFNISPPERTDDPEDPSNLDGEGHPIQRDDEGIVAFDPEVSETLVSALREGEGRRPRGLKVLNVTLFAVSVEQLGRLLEGVGRGLLVLSVTVDLKKEDGKGEGRGKWKRGVLEVLGKWCPVVEQVEVVARPAAGEGVPKLGTTLLEAIFPTKSDMQDLQKKCPNLASFKGSILRNISFGAVDWNKESGQQGAGETAKGKGEWKGAVVKP